MANKKIILKQIHYFVIRTYIKLYGMTHKTQKKIIFTSFEGKHYSDNPRAVSEKFHEMYPEYELEWFFNEDFDNGSEVPDYVTEIKGSRFKLYNSIATSAGYVSNESFVPSIYKKKDQCFAQLWHGDRGFKKILYDSVGKGNGYTYWDDKLADFCTAGSDFAVGVFRSAFDYHGEILNVGIPRNDKLICNDEEERERIRRKLGIDADTRLMLYAPTFRRGSSGPDKVLIDLSDTLKHLNKNGEKWVCAFRAHSSSKGLLAEPGMIDLSDYPDMADLLLAADMLITDYSSCAGDFILTDKPLILAQFDIDDYIKNSRELYFDVTEPGYVIANDQTELNNIIDTYGKEDYIKSNRRVMDFYGVTETGRSAEIICRKIHDICEKNLKK